MTLSWALTCLLTLSSAVRSLLYWRDLSVMMRLWPGLLLVVTGIALGTQTAPPPTMLTLWAVVEFCMWMACTKGWLDADADPK